ncbi:MAG: diguanylate cyclase [Nitrospirae bacterium]|nr:diguanylate cyclase [Nitrospirota bacterium]
MTSLVKTSEKLKYGVTGALVGATAPLMYTLVDFNLFHGDKTFSAYLRDVVLSSPENIITHVFIAGSIFVVGAVGVLVGKLREDDVMHQSEILAKNLELERSQAELKDLTENLEKKVVEGREELVESSRKLKEANAKLLRQIEIQRKIAGNVPSLLALLDANMTYVEMNEYGARQFLGKPLVDILGHKCYEVLGGKDDVCIEDCAARKAFQTGKEATHSRTTEIKGRTVVTENKSIPVKNAEGVVTHVLQIVTDATARRKEEDELKRRANRDALTGVYNKHYLNLYLENEEKKNINDKRKRGPYTIIYADLDNLKDANDTYGHEAGDILLKKMSQIFQDNTRHEDIIARVGGDEFVIILPHSGPEEGEVLISRFKRQADEWNETKDLSENLLGLNLSVSYGLGTSIYGTDLYTTIKKADSFMYRAKKDKKAVAGQPADAPPAP